MNAVIVHYVQVHDELDAVIGATGKARYALREKLPYTYAVIKEVMRFRTIAPLLIPHTVKENVKFKGYEIPKVITKINVFNRLIMCRNKYGFDAHEWGWTTPSRWRFRIDIEYFC